MSRREQRRRGRSMAPRLFVFTEGKTELQYLGRFRGRGMPVSVILVQAGSTDVAGIMRYCRNELAVRGYGGVEGDRAFVVFDLDRNPRDRVEETDRGSGDVGMLMSNPSFEYWLLLHFENLSVRLEQEEMEERLGRHLGRRYAKGEDITRLISDGMVDRAIARAERRLPGGRCSIPGCLEVCPSTMVHLLVRELREMASSEL